MENNFSKFGLATGLVAIGKKLPAITLPTKKNAPKSLLSLNHYWLLGGIVVILTVSLLILLIIGLQQARHAAAQPELVSQLKIQHLQLVKAVHQVQTGSATAFSQLQNHQQQLNQSVTLLIAGGVDRNGTDIPAANDPLSHSLEAFQKSWQQDDQRIQLILKQQESLLRLHNSIRAVHITYRQLRRRSEEITSRMLQIGNLPQEVRAIEAIKMHVRDVATNVKAIMPVELTLTEISRQLARDQAQISALMQVLSQGSNGLGTVSGKDETIQDLLSHLYASLRKLDDHLRIIQQDIPIAVTVQSAIDEIADHSNTMLDKTDALDNDIRAQVTHSASLFNWLTVFLAACTGLALIFFIRAIRRNAQYQDLSSRNEMAKTQKAMVKLLDDMKKIADGDLTVRTDITNQTTGAIADAINCTIEELHTLVEQVNQAGMLVVKSSNQAQQVSSGLLAAAQQQTAKIEQTTIAVLGMTESIGGISDMATESAKVAKQSLAAAEKGTLAVRESIAGMNEIRTYIQDTSKRIKRLGESSQEIGEIVALITDITDQTNVLALNAALQATAAGEAGQGFTVIAQEVQRLAERSAEASKQIGELITTIQGDTQDAITAMERSTLGVAKGTKRSDAAGRALEEIEKVSTQLAQLVTHIFEVTSTQTRAAHKVVANMEEILHITRQNTEGTLKTTGSIKQITGFASELKASVSNFKV
ncbi:methyl-accepting chemotaxis protein [Nitrosomonas sp.]|uniref:methyl-accepting chemotaxis protein n=1 Tax=Nitrosomonas sp. TaxID=42353 RepID=UPI001D8FD40A|nr:methyl-accepting chemotaxis protein [Nitrosomonas sp.]MBX3617705.1 methyl-accepting chemotaxis protein [Nitrosomonas sp.]